MAKLNMIAGVVAQKTLKVGKGKDQFLVKPKDKFQLLHPSGKSADMVVLGMVGAEIVIREKSVPGPSKILGQLRSWSLVKTALWTAGIARWISGKN